MKWGRSETLRGKVLTDVAQIDRDFSKSIFSMDRDYPLFTIK